MFWLGMMSKGVPTKSFKKGVEHHEGGKMQHHHFKVLKLV